MGRKYLAWASKYMVALWVALVIIAVIAIRPMYWLGSIGFGWVMFWLAVAVVLLFTSSRTYLRSYKTKSLVKSIPIALLWGTLIVGTIVAGIVLWSSRPELSAGEVKTLSSGYKTYLKPVRAEYEGGGIWLVRFQITGSPTGGVHYLNYDERSGAFHSPSPPPLRSDEARVTKVIDGDTIEVTDAKGTKQTVRYIGIDAPERKTLTVPFPSRSGPNEPFLIDQREVERVAREVTAGNSAWAQNRALVEGETVRLKKDVSETDKYGRLLRYVYVGDLFVNAEMVRYGFAKAAPFPPDVKYQELFLQLEREAREAKRGLWEIR